MQFLIMILLITSFTSITFADEYDVRNRQGCIDELKNEVDKVCTPEFQQSAGSVMGMLKNASFIAETDSRVRRVCSYHCPQDITAKCHALLGQGPALLKDVLTGKKNMMAAYSEGCKALQGRIEVAKKEISEMMIKAGTVKAQVESQLAKGEFRKPSSAAQASQAAVSAAPAKPIKCNPYNASGAFEMGKCP